MAINVVIAVSRFASATISSFMSNRGSIAVSRSMVFLIAASTEPGNFSLIYHHNDPFAYLPLVVGILDAELVCSATLPAVGEMSASLHIAGTNSSILDSVFVCRRRDANEDALFSFGRDSHRQECASLLEWNDQDMQAAGVSITKGDLRCLVAGHIARLTVNSLSMEWRANVPVTDRLIAAKRKMSEIMEAVDPNSLVEAMTSDEQGSSSVKARKAS